jgi:hypothetical protein
MGRCGRFAAGDFQVRQASGEGLNQWLPRVLQSVKRFHGRLSLWLSKAPMANMALYPTAIRSFAEGARQAALGVR